MPKQRITKEMVVNAAFEIARSSGMEQVLVKNIADRIGCSVQPIYSYCKNMEGLRRDVTDQVSRFIQEYIAARVDKADLFRSTGNAYIQLAKEDRICLRFLYCGSGTGSPRWMICTSWKPVRMLRTILQVSCRSAGSGRGSYTCIC